MNLKQKSFLIGAVMAASISSANAADANWYVSGFANNSDLDTVNTVSQSTVGGVARRIDIESDDDTQFGLTIGRKLLTQSNGNTLSVELSYNTGDYDVENIAFMGNDFLAGEGRSEGNVETDTILARAVYQFELGSINPYLGVGVGRTDLEVDGRYGGSVGQPNQARPPFITDGDSATAIELRAGLEYSLTESLGLFLEYTFTDVSDVTFTRRGGGPGGLATTIQEGDLEFDAINLGARFSF